MCPEYRLSVFKFSLIYSIFLMEIRNTHVLVLTAALLILYGGCSPGANRDTTLVIAAASNLQFAFKEIAEKFEDSHTYSVSFVWGSTGSLANQIRYGAPYDIFFAANQSFTDALSHEGYLLESPVSVLKGHIVLGVAKANKNTIKSLQDLGNADVMRIAIATPKHAPFGIAAREALINSGLWNSIQQKLIYAESIRQCIQFVISGNVDAGIISGHFPVDPELHVIAVDEDLYSPIYQTVAILKAGNNPDKAREFIRYNQTAEAAAIFKNYNYTLVSQ